MGIGSWFSARDRSRIARSIGIRPCRRRRRDGRRSEATPVETLEQRLYLSAAPIDSGHDEDGADHAHSFWYIPPDFTGPLPDEGHAEDQPNHFVASGYKWPQSGGLGTPVTVTYSYSNLLDGGLKGGLTAAQLRSAVEKALGLWASVAPLHFVEVVDSGPIVSDNSYSAGTYPKIRIGHEYIDGGSGANILAHAYFPTGSGLAGDLHLDNSNTWKLGPSGGIDVIEVLTHELGHALGLDHEPTPSGSVGNNAIMNPYYGARYTTGLNSAHLLQDDINGIRTIYGTGVGSVIPLANSGSGGADDHGNSATGASTITIGTSVAGNLEVTSDQDWFKFQATAGITYTFQTALGSLSDSVIRLYNTNGATLLRTNDNAAGIGLASKIEWTASLSGTYFLSVVGAQISQTGTYTLATSARNMPPILASIGSKSMSYTQDTLSISLSASDLNGDPLTYSARVVTNVSPLVQTAYQLDQQNGFYVTSDFPLNDYYKNARGAGEKYLRGSNNAWYLIFANGELYRWHTSLADLELIQILDSSYYNDPSLLWNAQPVNTPNITATVNGSTLTINPPPGYLGTFEVEVTVSDGSLFDFETISVTTVNLPATLAPVQDQTMSHTSDTIQVTLLGADPDGDVLTYSAEVVGSAANHQIDQSRGLYVTADFLTTNYYFNARGAGEKYLMGDNGSWYLLYSDGKLFQWGTSLADCTLVAEFDPACFQNPSLVWNTQPLSVVNDVVTTITQNQLTINPPSGFAGAFQVHVRVSDGTNVATQVFTVDVANIPPVLAPIGNRTMSRSQNTIEIDLAATDADADLITYDVTISGGNEAYQFDQTYGFFVTSDFLGTVYYVNARGVGEKYLMGNNGTWFLLYADGKLYQWGGSLAASTLIAVLDPGF
ncbi:MAG: matrixin family metalloprotease [Planctomycetaceae bacterium]